MNCRKLKWPPMINLYGYQSNADILWIQMLMHLFQVWEKNTLNMHPFWVVEWRNTGVHQIERLACKFLFWSNLNGKRICKCRSLVIRVKLVHMVWESDQVKKLVIYVIVFGKIKNSCLFLFYRFCFVACLVSKLGKIGIVGATQTRMTYYCSHNKKGFLFCRVNWNLVEHKCG